MKLKIIIALVFFSNTIFAQAENEKLIITHLTGDFYVYTTFNKYKDDLMPANGLYLVTNMGVVMIDSPWDTTQFQPLLDSIKSRHNADVVMCIATHSHEDRTAGLEYYSKKGIKTYTTKRTDDICKRTNAKRPTFIINNDTIFTIGQYTFQTYYPGKGHAPDNIVVWFEKDKILYGGCFIKSVEAIDLGFLGDANVKQWSKSLVKVQKNFINPAFIIPGHQDWISNKSLEHTLELTRKH